MAAVTASGAKEATSAASAIGAAVTPTSLTTAAEMVAVVVAGLNSTHCLAACEASQLRFFPPAPILPPGWPVFRAPILSCQIKYRFSSLSYDLVTPRRSSIMNWKVLGSKCGRSP